MNKDKTFEELWNEAYITYLKFRVEYFIPITPEQAERLKEYQNAKNRPIKRVP